MSSQNKILESTMSVLVIGIYLANKKNTVEHLVETFNTDCKWNVVQKWIAIGGKTQSAHVKNATQMKVDKGTPKFVLLNKLLAQENLEQYDFVIICDDDIQVPEKFLQGYLEAVKNYDFALAQPARTHNSYIDWPFVEQLDGIDARRTNYVEIGPIFSVRRDIYPVIFPFDESSYMGWGFDFVWPGEIERLGLRMGIIDSIPIEHSIRKPVNHYKHSDADESMQKYLTQNYHFSKSEAFRILESYA